MEWSACLRCSYAAGLTIRGIEHVGRSNGPSPEGVQALSVEICAGGFWISKIAFFGDRKRIPDPFGLVGIDWDSTDARDHQIRGGQGPISQDHRRHAEAACAGNPLVLRVLGPLLKGRSARLPVGRTQDQTALEAFGIPSFVAVLGRKVIEQWTMDRILALDAKVLGGLDQTDTEKMLPDAVDGHACRQRVFGCDEPLGKAEPISGSVLGEFWQKGGSIKGDGISGFEVFAPFENVRLTRLCVAHDHGSRDLIGSVSIEFISDRLLCGKRWDFGCQVAQNLLIEMLPERGFEILFLLIGPVRFGLVEHREDRFGYARAVCDDPQSPAVESRIDQRLGFFLKSCELGFILVDAFLVLFGGEFEQRGSDSDAARKILRHAVFGDPIKSVHQRIIIPHGDRIVFVVMALGAGHRQTQPGGGCRVDPIKENHIALLLGNRSTFAVEQMVAIESAGDLLIVGRIGQQVAGKLPEGELVEGEVFIQGPYHPIAPEPLPSIAVLLESIAIGIAGSIEP